MNLLKDPVFKGCTRPAMLWGVPLVPFLMVGGGMLVPAIWALLTSPPFGIGLLFLMIPVFITMRVVTRRDDQRLAQLRAAPAHGNPPGKPSLLGGARLRACPPQEEGVT